MSLGITPAVSMNTLKSRILNPSLSSVYAVLIEKPSGSGFSPPSWDRELLELTCVEASLPGSSIATIETNRDFHGVVERHAYSRLFDETIDFTFMVTQDSDYMQIRYFDYWMKYIVGEDGKTDTELSGTDFVSRIRYPVDYQCNTMKIVKFEKDLGSGFNSTSKVLVYNFVQAFPKAINTVPVSYEASQALRCTVSFTYSRYFISSVTSSTDSNSTTSSTDSRASGVAESNNWNSALGISDSLLKSTLGTDYKAFTENIPSYNTTGATFNTDFFTNGQ